MEQFEKSDIFNGKPDDDNEGDGEPQIRIIDAMSNPAVEANDSANLVSVDEIDYLSRTVCTE